MENKLRSEQSVGNNSYQFVTMRPGGNDTCLILGIITDPLKRKKINDEVMKMFPSVEQVGFISLNSNKPQLMMAGGEFCGNATRSTAYFALAGKPGAVEIKVSGVNNKLRAGVTADGEAFAQMPIYREGDRVVTDPDDPRNSTVYMEGITQYVNWDATSIDGKNEDQIKSQAMNLIREKELDKGPAAGIMYIKKSSKGLEIVPVVYVRDIDTLFYETACGSGTTAVGLTLAKQAGSSIRDIPIFQPSGLPIKVTVEYDGKDFTYAQIQGPIKLIGSGTLGETEKGSYAIEQMTSLEDLEKVLKEGALIKLYKGLFSKAPYFENFNSEEVSRYFINYVKNGLLFLAKSYQEPIGFGAAVPLSLEPEIASLASQFGIDQSSAWYMADLGVREQFQRFGIGKKLVEARLNALPRGVTALMRTSVDNVASQSIYKSLGFTVVEGMIQEVEGKRIDGIIKKDNRIFLAKVL